MQLVFGAADQGCPRTLVLTSFGIIVLRRSLGISGGESS
jgi:hypothetical protein